MKHLERLIQRIIGRVNVNLREPAFDVEPYLTGLISPEKFIKFYAFYGLTPHHPLYFRFHNSSLAGSYFLGKCMVEHSVLYKSDIRGDELKRRGDVLVSGGLEVPLYEDEKIRIRDSFLVKTLVHNNSHDPENPEELLIQNTVAMHYANIHGSRTEGAFLGPFSTVDLTTVRSCVVGAFTYVQCGEAIHQRFEPGQIILSAQGAFSFSYRFQPEDLKRYVHIEPGNVPTGIFMDFIESRKHLFSSAFEVVDAGPPIPVPAGASLNRYAMVVGDTSIGENVLVAQRAFLEDARLGKGSNAQENCCIVSSRLDGNNITAHGGKVVHARLGKNVFVGFNSFLRGGEDRPLIVGAGSIVMPHTIIDIDEPVEIPPEHLVWGYIRHRKDLARHSLPLETVARAESELVHGAMILQGSGGRFVETLRRRIEHILEANGAYFDGRDYRGHAQKSRQISFNIIQPYPAGTLKGLYPTIEISLPLAAMGIQKTATG